MNGARFVLPLVAAALFAALAVYALPRAVAAGDILLARDDADVVARAVVEQTFSAPLAEREVDAALASEDVDLARSLQALAQARGIALAPEQAARIDAAEHASAALSHGTISFLRGFFQGDSHDAAALAGAAAGDLIAFGDLRDIVREAMRHARGEAVDPLMLGLAGGGLALTAASYASFSAAVPARAGLSLVKAGRRAGSIGAPFLASFRVLTKDGMVRLGRDVAAIRDTAGTRAALDALKLAQRPRDVAALARIAENQGSRTRAILKVAGRGALTLGALAFDLASWLFGAVVTLIGFCAAVKRAAERATERYLFRRKLRRLRAVAPT